jgi:ABC-type hemin transport system ATPase subunit
LAPNQTITFGPQLTVVYGNNGAGKSGYTRVLKAACRARAAEAILGNVVTTEVPLKAKANIRFVIGGAETPYAWDAAAVREPSLSTVKSHLKSIFAKLHVVSRTEAVTIAMRRGLVGR